MTVLKTVRYLMGYRLPSVLVFGLFISCSHCSLSLLSPYLWVNISAWPTLPFSDANVGSISDVYDLLKIIFPMLQKQHFVLETLPSYGTC